MMVSETDLTTWGVAALIVAAIATPFITYFSIREFRLWRQELRDKEARAEAEAALSRARSLADDLAKINREADAVAATGGIKVVRASRKGRTHSDKSIVAAEGVLREVDGE